MQCILAFDGMGCLRLVVGFASMALHSLLQATALALDTVLRYTSFGIV